MSLMPVLSSSKGVGGIERMIVEDEREITGGRTEEGQRQAAEEYKGLNIIKCN